MIRAHTDAIMTLLDAGLDVYESRAPAGAATPYVVLHPGQGNALPMSYDGDSTWRAWPFQTTCVSDDVDGAQWAAEKVEARLLDVTPIIAARGCSPIRKTVTVPVARDESVQPPVYIARDLWAFNSIPA